MIRRIAGLPLLLISVCALAQIESSIDLDPIVTKPGRQEIRERFGPRGGPVGPVLGVEILPPFRIGFVRRLKLEPPDAAGLQLTGADADVAERVRETLREPEDQLDEMAKGVARRGPLWIDVGAAQPVREGTYLLRCHLERINWDGPRAPIAPPLLLTMMERAGVVAATFELIEPATGRVALRVSLERVFDRSFSRVSGALQKMYSTLGEMLGAILRAIMDGDALSPPPAVSSAPAASVPSPAVTAPAVSSPASSSPAVPSAAEPRPNS